YMLQTADIWNGFLKSYDDAYLKLVKQNIDERGLTVVNLCCDLANLWDDDPDTQIAYDKMAQDCLKAAEILGAKTIRIDTGVRENTFSDKHLEQVSKKYREYCKRAAHIGARLGPENHWGASTHSPTELKKLFDAVGMDNFGILLHLGNWQTEDEATKDQYDLEMIDKAFHIHINYEHCLDADRVLPPLAKKGYSGCWTVESHKGVNEYNNVAFQLAQARRVLAPLYYDTQEIITIPKYED
ncbi:MAG: sugar phosphate isomerase/epimerase, partial [Defluviitaleaceae bacterium]|nr:sugar phosphate isomerase/epimerase [Defluviitaleaceae bacterium]